MRYLLATSLVLVLGTTSLYADSKPQEHKSTDGKFVIKVSGKVKKETKKLAINGSGLAVPVTTEKVEGPNSTYFAVTYADYPESFKEVPVKKILDGVRDGLKGVDGKVTVEEPFVLGKDEDKVNGREYRIEASSRSVVRVRVFLVDTRLYQVMVTGSRDQVGSKSATEFLDSFKLMK